MNRQQLFPNPCACMVLNAVAVKNAFYLPYTPHGQGCVEMVGGDLVRLAVRGNGHVA